MPTHAILITWKNMVGPCLGGFLGRARKKTDYRLDEIYYEEEPFPQIALRTQVNQTKKGERLKIFVCGHGGTGIDYIADDTETQKKTVDELATLLAYGLSERTTTRETSSETQVNMISCLFGRSANGTALCPAVKLHMALTAKKIYVDLVARTESIHATDKGRYTSAPVHTDVFGKIYDNKHKFAGPKSDFTKLLCTFKDGHRGQGLVGYSKDDVYIETSTREGRRLTWADHACDQMVSRIKLVKTADGGLSISDSRQDTFRQLCETYATLRNPERLKKDLADLVAGRGDDPAKNFLIHRGKLSSIVSMSEPDSAVFVRELLRTWPT